MFTSTATLSYDSKQNIAIWLALTFQAGAINAGAFIVCHKFVTHTTGFLTNFGTELAQGHFMTSLGVAIIPVFFMVGVMTSAFAIDNRIQKDKRPLYPIAMGLSAIILTVILFSSLNGFWGVFGEDIRLEKQFLLLAPLAFVSGLINGTVTAACGTVIRITHMTGLTTDLAIGITRVFSHSHKLNSRKNEIRANIIRFLIMTFFALGATASAIFFSYCGFWAFALPSFFSLLLFSWSLIRFIQPRQGAQIQNYTVKAL